MSHNQANMRKRKTNVEKMDEKLSKDNAEKRQKTIPSEIDMKVIKYAAKGMTKDIKALFSSSLSLNGVDSSGYTALMRAAENNHIEAVEFLLSKGADPTIRNQGKTARILAALKGLTSMAKILMKAEVKSGLFSGMFAPTMTEFEEKTQDLLVQNTPAYAKHLVSTDVRGVFAPGTSGESMTLSEDERRKSTEAWCNARDDKNLPLAIIAQVGCESISAACALAAHAEKAGADAVACMIPTFFKPASVEHAVQFCAKVASAAPCTPFFFYQFPVITNSTMKASDWFRKAKEVIPTLSGLKFTSTDIIDYGYLCEQDPKNEYAFLPGYEPSYTAFVPYHNATGRRFGAVALQCNFLNPIFSKFCKIAEDDKLSNHEKFKQLEKLQGLIRSVANVLGRTTALGVLKTAMAKLGVVKSTEIRLPNRNMAKEEVKLINTELDVAFKKQKELLGTL